ACTTLHKGIHAKSRHTRQAVGDVTRALLAKIAERVFVIADQFGGNVAGVVRSKHAAADSLKSSVHLNQRRLSGREKQVADFWRATQHSGQQSRDRKWSRGRLSCSRRR